MKILSLFLFAPLMSFAQASGPSPRFNEVFQLSSHNAYWVNRHPPEIFASGVQERLLDQLLFDHTRSLEIDVHKDLVRPGQWDVYHTSKQSNVFCSPFIECLKQLKQFHYAQPHHEVVTIMIELKEIFSYNFDSKHSPADFDALIEEYLGDSLYRPRDFLSRCPTETVDGNAMTMRECAKLVGWPSVKDLRGKFMFAILGNWRWTVVGHGSEGWATYANWGGGTRERTGFPMISDWTTDEPMSAVERARAENESIVLQAEDYSDPVYLAHLQQKIAEGVVVRMDNAFSVADQTDRVKKGFQYLQTDYPWIQYQDHGPAEPFKGFDGSRIEEPGNRLLMTKQAGGSFVTHASLSDTSAHSEWEGIFSSTRTTTNPHYPNPYSPRGKGCFEVASSSDAFRICRNTVGSRPAKVIKPHPEDAEITVEVTRGINTPNPVSTQHSYYSDDHQAGTVGDMVKLNVDTIGTTICVSGFSASEIYNSGEFKGAPHWNEIARECFDHPLTTQGIVASEGDVLFVGVKHSGSTVRASELTVPPIETGFKLSDLSVDFE